MLLGISSAGKWMLEHPKLMGYVSKPHLKTNDFRIAAATQIGTIWMPPVFVVHTDGSIINFSLADVKTATSIHVLNVFAVDEANMQLVRCDLPQVEWLPNTVYELEGQLPYVGLLSRTH